MVHADRSLKGRAEMSYEILTKAENDTGIKQLDGWTVYTDGDQPRRRKHTYFHDLIQPLGL